MLYSDKNGNELTKEKAFMKYYLILFTCILFSHSNVNGKDKFNPGHYATLESNYTMEELQELLKTQGLAGVQLRYAWASLETEKGEYDFSRIETALAAAANLKKHLIVFFVDKSFQAGKRNTPEYLWEEYTIPSGRSRNGERGFISKRYDDYVVERILALMGAMAKKFDDHPWFEGVSFQESAIGLTKENMEKYGYTPEKYRDALIDILIGMKQRFKSSQVFWYMNFLEGGRAYISDVAAAIAPHKILMGGPDILPDSKVLNKMAYPFYEEFKDELLLFCSVQYDSYRHQHADENAETTYWTLEEIYLWGRENLYIDYCFWNVPGKPMAEGAYDWDDAKPVILKYQTIENLN